MTAAEALAWGWADHLAAGGSTPWLEWCAHGHPATDADRRGPVPDAAQLELVRRLAARRGKAGSGPEHRLLAARSLARSGPGRGPAHLPLVDPGSPVRPTLGAPPVDPATVPAGQLVRAGVGLLADLLVDLRPGADPVPEPQGRPRLVRRGFRLAGPPLTVAALRADLAAAGHHEGGRRPRVVVLAPPLDALLHEVWVARVQDGSPVRWAMATRRWMRGDRLPPAADLAATAAALAQRAGPEAVHVVTGPDLRRTALQVLGRTAASGTPARPRALTAAGADLVRRVTRVLDVRLEEHDAASRRRHLVDLLPLEPVSPPAGPAVPEDVRDWVDDQAARVVEELAAGGYSVHGDLARIAPRHHGVSEVPPDAVLDAVLDLVLDIATRVAQQLTTQDGEDRAEVSEVSQR